MDGSYIFDADALLVLVTSIAHAHVAEERIILCYHDLGLVQLVSRRPFFVAVCSIDLLVPVRPRVDNLEAEGRGLVSVSGFIFIRNACALIRDIATT